MVLDNINSFFKVAFKSSQQMKYEAISRIIEKIFLVLFVVFISIKKLNINYIYSSFIIASIISILFSVFILIKNYDLKVNRNLIKFDHRKVLAILKESWVFFFNGIFWIVYFRIDTTMLQFIKGSNAVAIYGVAYSLFSTVYVIPGIIGIVIFPYMSNVYGKSKNDLNDFVKRTSLYFILISIVSTIAVIIFSTLIITIFFTHKYANSIFTLQILSGTLMFAFLSALYVYFLIVVKYQKNIMLIIFCGAIFNILLNMYLIPRFSYNGAAIATVVTEGIILLLYYFNYLYARSKIGISG